MQCNAPFVHALSSAYFNQSIILIYYYGRERKVNSPNKQHIPFCSNVMRSWSLLLVIIISLIQNVNVLPHPNRIERWYLFAFLRIDRKNNDIYILWKCMFSSSALEITLACMRCLFIFSIWMYRSYGTHFYPFQKIEIRSVLLWYYCWSQFQLRVCSWNFIHFEGAKFRLWPNIYSRWSFYS